MTEIQKSVWADDEISSYHGLKKYLSDKKDGSKLLYKMTVSQQLEPVLMESGELVKYKTWFTAILVCKDERVSKDKEQKLLLYLQNKYNIKEFFESANGTIWINLPDGSPTRNFPVDVVREIYRNYSELSVL